MSDKFETVKTRGGHMTLNVTKLKNYQQDNASKKSAKVKNAHKAPKVQD
jgi:hypothetical protein